MSQPPAEGWRSLALLAAVLCLTAVLLGALGSHVIPLQQGTATRLWDIALQMHLAHAVALLAIAALVRQWPVKYVVQSGQVLAVGTILFCGSIYLRAAGIGWLPSFLPPVGGLLMVAGWCWLSLLLLQRHKH